MAQGPSRDDLDALKEGAAMLVQAGNRVAALSLLWSAVAIDPTDLSSHRRLAATLAHSGDLDAAADEFARYIEFVLPLGDIPRAMDELSYGVSMVGGHEALHGAADKIASAVRGLVPPAGTAILPTPPLAAIAAATAAKTREALPAPRLLPKVPFRFCLHPSGGRHWMQLEGGAPDLQPSLVRVTDKWDSVIDERPCLPLAPNEGHAPHTSDEAAAVSWVVIGVPDQAVAAYDADAVWPCTFQAKVGDEWLALDLVDSGCRLGRVGAVQAS
jgi:hypothetical protein